MAEPELSKKERTSRVGDKTPRFLVGQTVYIESRMIPGDFFFSTHPILGGRSDTLFSPTKNPHYWGRQL
jgi:hypothetical protein